MSSGIVYYASCMICHPGDKWQRFPNQKKRDYWSQKHAETTGHTVVEGEQYEGVKVNT
jgi:cytochrome c5